MSDNDPSFDHGLDQAFDHGLDRSLAETARGLRGWETPALDASDRAALWTAIQSRVPTSAPPPHPPASAARPPAPWIAACVMAIGALAALLTARGRSAVDVGVRHADPARTVPAEATVVGRRSAVALRPMPGAPPATSPATSPSTSPVRPAAVEHQAAAIVDARPSPIASLPDAEPPVALAPNGSAPTTDAGTNRRPDAALRRDVPAGTARPTVTPGPVLPAHPLPGAEPPTSSPTSTAPPPTMPAASPATGIAGVVRSHDGRPIAHAVVRAVPEDDAARFVVAVTDDAGAYTLDLPAGRWHVSAIAPGHAPRWWPDGAAAGEAMGVEVLEGRVTGGVDFMLPTVDAGD